MNGRSIAGAIGCVAAALAPVGAQGASKGDELGSYLADIGPGPVAAHEILGLPAGASTQLQTPKDIVAALDRASGDGAKEGFGLAIAPARIGNSPVAVGIATYSTSTAARLWGGTSFSYAQRSKTFDGTDYKESAVAVHVDYFLAAQDDPVIAARRAFIDCSEARMLDSSFADEVDKRFADFIESKGGKVTGADIDALKEQIRADALYDRFKSSGAEAAKCVRAGYALAKSKWNARQIGFTLGKGWIRGPAGGLPRSSLAQHASLTLAWSMPSMPDSLLNVTLRRVSKAIDTSTLAGTPRFEGSNFAAARYTYGHGDNQDTFLLAEISNAKSSRRTEADATFKYALGLDRKLADGIWLELRVGRSRVVDGDSLETKALMNLKLSPTPSIPKLLAGG